jgi:AcrR family transcriptional regulator
MPPGGTATEKSAGTGVGRPRGFDVDQALDQALLLFWQKGFVATSISDLTEAMGINRPSLYATFGNKESVFRRALERYFQGPSSYLQEALQQKTTFEVARHILLGIVDLICASDSPRTCLWVHSAMSCGDLSDPLAQEFANQRRVGLAAIRRRFERGIREGDLPRSTDAAALAQFLQTVNVGLSVQGATGATRQELMAVVNQTLRTWPGKQPPPRTRAAQS